MAEGRSLTEALIGEDCTFTVVTKDSVGKKTYSEIDEISVSVKSPLNKHIQTALTNLKDGRYTVSYRPTFVGEFTVSIKVAGTSIMGSPFTLKISKSTEIPETKTTKTRPRNENTANRIFKIACVLLN